MRSIAISMSTMKAVSKLLGSVRAGVPSVIKFSLFALLVFGLNACHQEGGDAANVQAAVTNANAPVLQVLKSPTCGCCEGWVSHVSERGFVAQISHPEDLALEKRRLGILPQLQSCHTAVSVEGYVFEGHIPANLIHRFLSEMPDDALGLAVPGMPVGSPGMELDDRFQPYDVLVMKSDGTTQVYARVNTQAEQY